MADVNYPELGDGSTPARWYNEGDLLHHSSGAVYRAEPSGALLPNGRPKLHWVLIQEPPK